MSTPATHALHTIEVRAERAIVQELRIMIEEVLALRPSLNMEDRAYADGLLLKLYRLIGDQLVLPECGNAGPAAHGLLLATAVQPSHDVYAAEPAPALA